MKSKFTTSFKLLIMLLFPFTFSFSAILAQKTIPATGGSGSGSGGSVSYTIGQVFYITNTGATGSATQGIQQPYEISVLTGIEEAQNITLVCSAYPNPVTDYLILKIEGNAKSQFIASLFDINGKLLESKQVTGSVTTISMENLAPATYFLKVVQTQGAASQQEIKTFKIIKK